MAMYVNYLLIDEDETKKINHLLSHEPANESECMGEDETIKYTVKFLDENKIPFEIDIKICGVQFEEGNSNLPWTEAILYKKGKQVAYTDPSDEFFGEWIIEYNGDDYVVMVEREEDYV